jgi:hypothetical protein
MSMTASHESRHSKQLCQRCRDRKAKFKYRGRVSADRDHTLCFECYRSQRNQIRAQVLTERRPLRALTPSQISHRQTMLAHLQNAARP